MEYQLLETSIWSGTQIVVNPFEPLKNQTDKCFKKRKENYKHFV